ncbi:MAG TPA: glycosyltransferase [Candidatus Methanoculleus thermohydrogenotrophicum]|jgi:glycosyltransferase involved in cell wall biosynthesis|nr:glycosyltransferase [Candidatus Methanoculleus thermohydrogenotrophicum]NLM82678.1 glycosyltransferase [Candidatus Methanoculleus thermohydrogenotrophicum]HOB17710.1 glycosyltransferase [Candidatus Methanoculleus thermohydrogenotrophicum]HPZ37933.1 glycosyltransferase [Candidatus Methanoculleus thermohydrogenotrophicum]HQC91117.1 glycosyltransferase [Candidatus Methanoculleus thermohydrogenotrophicum]
MKILQVTPFFKPLWESGGVARVAYDISRNLHENGHEITVYTTNRSIYPNDLPTNRATCVDGMNVYYFENLRKYIPGMTPPVMPYRMPAVARREIAQFDIIHIHDHRTLLTVIASHYARKYGVPYVLQAHGALPQDTGSTWMKRIFDLIWAEKVILGAAGVIALNETEAERYRELGVDEDRIAIIPNGIDLAEYPDLPARGRFREKWGIDDATKIVLYLGRLDPTKGIDLLIRSFAGVAREFDDAVLMLVGEDMGHNEEFRELVRSLGLDDRVIFTGFVSKEDKMAAFTDADVFATPSFTGFPITFLEACLCGTPIVTTARGDLLTWIEGTVGYNAGYTPEEVTDAIVRLLADDALRARFGAQAKDLVRTRYNWQAIVREVETLYSDITGRNRGAADLGAGEHSPVGA